MKSRLPRREGVMASLKDVEQLTDDLEGLVGRLRSELRDGKVDFGRLIEIADEIGFSTATLASMRLPLIRIASIASGMPWPRIRSDPYLAIRPMISAPITGMTMTNKPRWLPTGELAANVKRP